MSGGTPVKYRAEGRGIARPARTKGGRSGTPGRPRLRPVLDGMGARPPKTRNGVGRPPGWPAFYFLCVRDRHRKAETKGSGRVARRARPAFGTPIRIEVTFVRLEPDRQLGRRIVVYALGAAALIAGCLIEFAQRRRRHAPGGKAGADTGAGVPGLRVCADGGGPQRISEAGPALRRDTVSLRVRGRTGRTGRSSKSRMLFLWDDEFLFRVS
jgi:hypothetical protein